MDASRVSSLRTDDHELFVRVLESSCALGWWHIVEKLVRDEDAPVTVQGMPLAHLVYIDACLDESDNSSSLQALESLMKLPSVGRQSLL
eukprot:819170-Rhodomonas_salina.1